MKTHYRQQTIGYQNNQKNRKDLFKDPLKSLKIKIPIFK